MVAAGDVINASDVNFRVGTATPVVADSTTWAATETGALVSVAANLVTGKKYRITFYTAVSTSSLSASLAAFEISTMRLREDSSTGTQLLAPNVQMSTASTVGFFCTGSVEYTAVATGAKTFVLTGQRNNGAGNHQIRAGATRPTTLVVDMLQQA